MVPPTFVAVGLVDDVLLSLAILDRRAPGDRLLRLGGRTLGSCVQLTRLGPRFRTRDVLDLGEFEEVAKLAGVQEEIRRHDALESGRLVAQRDRLDAIAYGRCRTRRVFQPQLELAVGEPRRKHVPKHREKDTRFGAESPDRAHPRVEEGVGPHLGTQGIVRSVVVSNPPSQFAVGDRASGLFDPGMLVGGHHLSRELPPRPVRRLGENDPTPETKGRVGGGHAAYAGTHDEDLGLGFGGRTHSARVYATAGGESPNTPCVDGRGTLGAAPSRS